MRSETVTRCALVLALAGLFSDALPAGAQGKGEQAGNYPSRPIRVIVPFGAADAVRERLLALGAEPVGNSPEEFGRHMRIERERWGKLIAQIGLKLD